MISLTESADENQLMTGTFFRYKMLCKNSIFSFHAHIYIDEGSRPIETLSAQYEEIKTIIPFCSHSIKPEIPFMLKE